MILDSGDTGYEGENEGAPKSLEFPATHLYNLEERVFTSQWNIPYKREESLGRCLLAATRLAKVGVADSDENCRRFIDQCLPECFQKVRIIFANSVFLSLFHKKQKKACFAILQKKKKQKKTRLLFFFSY